jgi:hypothetical protein
MPSNWLDAARQLLRDNPGLSSRILRELLKVELPPVIQYTALTQLCEDDSPGQDGPPGLDSSPDRDDSPELIILAGPASDPVHAIVVEFLVGRDDEARRRWPRYVAAVWLAHKCPVDLFVLCPDDLTAHWADRPIATTLDDYVCHPVVLVLEDLGPISDE